MEKDQNKNWKIEYKKLNELYIKFKPNLSKWLNFSKISTFKIEIQKILNIEENMVFDIEIEEKNIYKDIRKITNDVNNLIYKLTNQDLNRDNLYELKKKSIKIESYISDFKENQKETFDELLNEELNLENDINLILDNYEKNKNFNKKETIKNSNTNNNNDKENENHNIFEVKLEKINILLHNNGGINCGWNNKDHKEFEILFYKYKNNKKKIINEASNVVPLYSEEEINLHYEIFIERLNLLEKRKKILKEIKEEKNKKLVNFDNKISKFIDKNIENKNNLSKFKYNKNERELNKLKLEKWKREKEIDKFIKIEKEKDIKKDKINTKKIDEVTKLRLKEYQEKKELEKLKKIEKLKYEKDINKKYISKEEKMRIKLKEEQMIKKKQKLIQIKEEGKRQKSEAINFNKKYNYVQSKLNYETNAALLKQRDKFDPSQNKNKFNYNANTFGGMLVKNQGRAVPNWMK